LRLLFLCALRLAGGWVFFLLDTSAIIFPPCRHSTLVSKSMMEIENAVNQARKTATASISGSKAGVVLDKSEIKLSIGPVQIVRWKRWSWAGSPNAASTDVEGRARHFRWATRGNHQDQARHQSAASRSPASSATANSGHDPVGRRSRVNNKSRDGAGRDRRRAAGLSVAVQFVNFRD
jgi:hypothetical protein